MGVVLTVLIPTHGRPVLLGRTLASVAACRRPVGYAGCLVVENGAPAGAEAVVADAAQRHPEAGFRYLHHGRANKSAALNAALAEVAGGPGPAPLCVFFDDDVRVEPGALEAYAEAAGRHPRRAFFGGPVTCDYEEAPDPRLLDLLPYSAKGFEPEDARRAGYFLGANWAASSQDLERVGLFDPAYGPGSPTGARGQEKDMQRRLRDAGCNMVEVPEATATHDVPRERCSPRWVIRRQRQEGALRGHTARVQGRSASLGRVLLRLPKRVARVAQQFFTGDPVATSVALAALSKDVGFVRGFLALQASR